jgi:hypothetical protein
MIFENPFFTEMLLPFLLVFVVVYAILQKSKVLGDGVAQIDAIVAFVVGLITITFTYQTGVITHLMAWLALGIGVILVFLILYGFVAGDLSSVPGWMKITFGILAGMFTIGVVVYVTGFWGVFQGWFEGSSESGLLMNIFMVLIVVGAAVLVAVSGKSGDPSGKGKKNEIKG